jgi:hypothetical protein
MRQKIFKKYNIAGESNPYWQLVEPMLLKIWAKGICEASYPKLHSILFFDLLSSTFLFLAGFLLRVSAVALFLSIGYVFFKDSLLLAFNTVLSSSDIGTSISISVDEEKIWIYKLLGYVILIISVIFIFGMNFTYLMLDIMMYILMTVTNMLPLKWTARGLKKENYFAQYFAKTSYMGTIINQTILAAPPEIVSEWDKVSDLYKNSNNEDARKELERLSATY